MRKGSKMSDESKLKMSLVRKGRKQTPESVAKRALSNTGKKRTEETKRKISEANKKSIPKGRRTNTGRTHFSKGFTPWNKGLIDWMSEEQRNNVIKAKKGIAWTDEQRKKLSIARTGDKNHLWKKYGCSYRSMHHWVERWLGKANKCSKCGKEGSGRQIHWSNIDHKYRRAKEDYTELCAKCHGEYDKNNNLRKHKKI